MAKAFHIRISQLPSWLDWRRLVGPGEWTTRELPSGHLEVEAELERDAVADLAARLRGVGIGGSLLSVEIAPPLNRKYLRQAYGDEARRYRKGSPGFTRAGTRLDDEGRFSLTPEALAYELGKRADGLRVVDACAGAGGNAIGFARAGCEVVAIEIDESRLAMARHNAKIYGVADRIEFVCGDAREMVAKRKADLVFIDPPWGEKYNKERVTLADLTPCEEVLEAASHIPRHWIKTPPSFDPSVLPGCRVEAFFGVAAGDDRRVKFLLVELERGL